MSKSAIRKNLSDADMMVNYKEEATFENIPLEDSPTGKNEKRSVSPAKQEDIKTAFFTPELQERVGKALLELKLELYKEGIVDYDVKVSRQGRQVILTAAPVNKKTNKK
jgi:hypothetical protein